MQSSEGTQIFLQAYYTNDHLKSPKSRKHYTTFPIQTSLTFCVKCLLTSGSVEWFGESSSHSSHLRKGGLLLVADSCLNERVPEC